MISGIVVDANVLVYYSNSKSPFYARARERLLELLETAELCISPQILREFLAAATRSTDSQPGIPLAQAEGAARAMLAQMRFLAEPVDVSWRLLDLLHEVPLRGARIHDANIVATMLHHGVTRLITNDLRHFMPYSDRVEVISL